MPETVTVAAVPTRLEVGLRVRVGPGTPVTVNAATTVSPKFDVTVTT
jgi:hypothetical protein